MKIAVIGLGSIAEKAYLPVLAVQPGLDLHLCTRNPETLGRLGEAYRISKRFTAIDDVITAGVTAAFVHAATAAHVEIVEPLLRAGVHVYLDKPIADNLHDARRLVHLAQEANRSLMVGFNRRYAPSYARLLQFPRNLIVMEKNRHALADLPRRVIFDDFVHVVDTLRFLAPGEITDTRFRTRVRNGLLEHVVLELSGDGFTAIGLMNRVSGGSEEICEVMGDDVKRRVVELVDVIDYHDGERITRPDGWMPVARRRGIEQISLEFLHCVSSGQMIDAADALVTHAICEDIVQGAK